VKSVVNGTTTYFPSTHYNVEGGTVSKYYFAGAIRVAFRVGSTLYYPLSDHLGSTSLTTNTSGTLVSELRYAAWGETRYTSGTTATDYRYSGQREESNIGLYFYNARWFDPGLGRFAQADTIVPNGVQGYDRYAAVNNNPIRNIDPSGHQWAAADGWGGSEEEKFIYVPTSLGEENITPVSIKPVACPYTSCYQSGSGSGPLTPYLTASNMQYIFGLLLTGGEYSAFRYWFTPAARPGNFGFSGSGLGIWGLRGTYYKGGTITAAFLRSTLSELPRSSFAVALVTNALDYQYGAHANEGLGSQGFVTSTVVDTTAGYAISGGLSVGAAYLLPASTPPGAAILGLATAGMILGYAFDASGARAATQRGLDSTWDLAEMWISRQSYTCDGWACR
jgi:RHS repeat-associated protein